MPNPACSESNDEHLQREMQALAELLLDIYDHTRQKTSSISDEGVVVLDANRNDRTIKERSGF